MIKFKAEFSTIRKCDMTSRTIDALLIPSILSKLNSAYGAFEKRNVVTIAIKVLVTEISAC